MGPDQPALVLAMGTMIMDQCWIPHAWMHQSWAWSPSDLFFSLILLCILKGHPTACKPHLSCQQGSVQWEAQVRMERQKTKKRHGISLPPSLPLAVSPVASTSTSRPQFQPLLNRSSVAQILPGDPHPLVLGTTITSSLWLSAAPSLALSLLCSELLHHLGNQFSAFNLLYCKYVFPVNLWLMCCNSKPKEHSTRRLSP